jgi:Mg2+ and Co2+ transporter CorA
MDCRGFKEVAMAEPQDLIVPMLREIRSEIRDMRDEVRDFRKDVERRLDNIEMAQKNFRNALSADSMMGKLVTGDFEERIAELEKRVATILDAS